MPVRALKWLSGRVLRVLPETLVGRILPGEYRFDAAARPAPVTAPEAGVRLYIGPTNYAGQGWQWARAVERHLPDAGAVNMMVLRKADFRHRADNVVPAGFYVASPRWQREQRDAVVRGFTHVIVEAERWPFGAPLDETVIGQVKNLVDNGVRVAMVCHGSDIRLPSRHAARHPESPFRDPTGELAAAYEKVARKNGRILDDLGLPVFVSTPDLMIDVPTAAWLPVVVELGLWESDAPVLERQRPVVAHVPSRGPMKGSHLIDPILRELEAEGLIEYRRVEKLPFAQMPAMYRDADVVLDQFLLADYGVAACEAMAAGRVVVANVSEHARSRVGEAVGEDLPIVQAVPSDLRDVLRRIVGDRDEARTAAERGREFVSMLHDGRRSAEVLGKFLS